jgi:hypothetical protein
MLDPQYITSCFGLLLGIWPCHAHFPGFEVKTTITTRSPHEPLSYSPHKTIPSPPWRLALFLLSFLLCYLLLPPNIKNTPSPDLCLSLPLLRSCNLSYLSTLCLACVHPFQVRFLSACLVAAYLPMASLSRLVCVYRLDRYQPSPARRCAGGYGCLMAMADHDGCSAVPVIWPTALLHRMLLAVLVFLCAACYRFPVLTVSGRCVSYRGDIPQPYLSRELSCADCAATQCRCR